MEALNVTPQAWLNYRSNIKGDNLQPVCKNREQLLNSTELLYQLTLFRYLMLQVNVSCIIIYIP